MLKHSVKMDGQGRLVVVDKKLGHFLASFSEETDRGIVIIVGTVLEERLGRLLTEVLVQGKESDSLITRNLRGLEARAKAAFCTGLISKREYEIIEFIRRLRNDFAHQFVTATFDGSLKAKKSEVFRAIAIFLPGYNSDELGTSRNAFEAIAIYIITSIWDRSHELDDADYIHERE